MITLNKYAFSDTSFLYFVATNYVFVVKVCLDAAHSQTRCFFQNVWEPRHVRFINSFNTVGQARGLEFQTP